MSNIKSSQKHANKSKKVNRINSSNKSMMRTLMKKVYSSIYNNNKDFAKKYWLQLQSVLDRFSRKKLIHKNKASRYKSRLYEKIQNLDLKKN